ncbi:hypothetical protein [Enemella sp. A6]|uniref:hypothetical protein n=1 Tax=Enemella sp. A6 TaxID=3440152 RepID=UPI003EC10BC1
MTAPARFWDECRVLVGTTVRTWRSLLPLMLLLQVISWFCLQSTMAVAAVITMDHPWLALGIFSVGFVLSLVVAVVMLRVVGDTLGTPAMVPDAEGEPEGRVGLTRMLGLTMLPLLAMYAAFGHVAEAVRQLTLITFAMFGSIGDNLLIVLSPNRAGVFTVLAVLIGAYVLRRVLDKVHERTGWRWMGLLVTITEAFFVMGVVLAASRWISNLTFWLRHRELMAWWDATVAGLATALHLVNIDLPAVLAWIGPVWQDEVAPSLIKALTEPLLWLAVAALVFGSRVVSVADMWRKGQPLSSQVPGARRLTLFRKMAATAEAKRQHPPGLGRRFGMWLQETFLGDIDDKYLPTLHAIRLVLKAGLPFLTAFVLLHNLVSIGKGLLTTALADAIGGHSTILWTGMLPGVELVVGLLLETVRLVLIAAAFHRCLQLFRARAHASDNPVPAPRPGKASATVAVTWRRLRGALAMLLVAIVVSATGWVIADRTGKEHFDYRDGEVGEPVAFAGMDVTVRDVQYGQLVPGLRDLALTKSRWVVVSTRLSAPGKSRAVSIKLVGPGGKLYRSPGGNLTVGDGQWTDEDLFFEVDVDDIGELKMLVQPVTEIVVREDAARIDLGPEPADVPRVIDESQWQSVPVRRLPEHGGN